MTRVCVVYHSGYGHTQKQAEAVAEGVASVDGVVCIPDCRRRARAADAPAWDNARCCDAMIFGSPTYMGSASAAFKAFMEATSQRWMEQRWATSSPRASPTPARRTATSRTRLMQFVTFAAQHGMLWVNLNQMPGNNSSAGSEDDMNRLGASLGAMAQSNVDAAAGRGADQR
jgi:NAD(P)H dehydrogenase (quinone)